MTIIVCGVLLLKLGRTPPPSAVQPHVASGGRAPAAPAYESGAVGAHTNNNLWVCMLVMKGGQRRTPPARPSTTPRAPPYRGVIGLSPFRHMLSATQRGGAPRSCDA